MTMGTVKWFNDAKGYGFISRADDEKDVFVHYSSIAGDGFRTLVQGQAVEYEEVNGPKGLFAAKVLATGTGPIPVIGREHGDRADLSAPAASL